MVTGANHATPHWLAPTTWASEVISPHADAEQKLSPDTSEDSGLALMGLPPESLPWNACKHAAKSTFIIPH